MTVNQYADCSLVSELKNGIYVTFIVIIDGMSCVHHMSRSPDSLWHVQTLVSICKCIWKKLSIFSGLHAGYYAQILYKSQPWRLFLPVYWQYPFKHLLHMHNHVVGWLLVHGRGFFGLFSNDVWLCWNYHTQERIFIISIIPSLHVSLNLRWMLMSLHANGENR